MKNVTNNQIIMDQLYKKIEIEGSSEFPKEGKFWFHFKKSNFWKECMQFWDVTVLVSVHKDTAYLRSVDFYLIPFTPDSKAVIMPTEATIMTYFNLHCGQMLNSYGIPISVMTRSQAIEMCNWYRSQLKTVNLKDELVKALKEFERFQEKMKRDNKGYSYYTFLDDYLHKAEEGK